MLNEEGNENLVLLILLSIALFLKSSLKKISATNKIVKLYLKE